MRLNKINQNLPYKIWCEMGSLTIPSRDITKLSINKESTASDDIQLGYACASTFKLSINNTSKNYSNVVFKDKRIKVYCEFITTDNTKEKKCLGTFNIELATKNNNIINLECIDDMVKFDTKWLGATFPMTLYKLLTIVCNQVEIPLANTEILNGEHTILKGNDIIGKSCRQVLTYISEVCGSFAFINSNGELEMKWYDLNNVKDSINQSYLNDFKYEENEVEISGVEALVGSESIQFGNKSYQLDFTEQNPILKACNVANATKAIEAVWNKRIRFMQYLPGSLKCRANPTIELGDVIEVIDDMNRPHKMIITSLNLSNNLSMTIESVSKSINSDSEYSSSFGKASEDTSKEVRFTVGRNYNAYEISQDVSQIVCSVIINTDASTMVLSSIALAYELEYLDTITSTTDILIELVVNGGVYHSWHHQGKVGYNDFAMSLIPFSFPVGQCNVSLRLSTSDRTIKLEQYAANLSLIVRGGEVNEAPPYPEINISQRYENVDALSTTLPIIGLSESLECGNAKYDSSVLEEIFRGIQFLNQDLLICKDNDFTKLLDMEFLTLQELEGITLEEISNSEKATRSKKER